MEFINKEIEECHNEYTRLLKVWHTAQENEERNATIFNRKKLQKECEVAAAAFKNYSRQVYAKAVYEAYSVIKPTLIDVYTGKECSWDSVFKPSFAELRTLDLSILVALVENGGGYKFK